MYPVVNFCLKCRNWAFLNSNIKSSLTISRKQPFSWMIRNVSPVSSIGVDCNRLYSSDGNSKDSLGSGQFEPFKNKSSYIIFDVDEEKQLALHNPDYLKLYQKPEEEINEFEGLNLERGVTGVYDIEDLVDVLKYERALNLCVIAIPPELGYVDFIVVAEGRSQRHMLAVASFVRRVFKKKYDADRGDVIPKIEGENSQDWIALDLGNISLHLFSKRARAKYDLESLWCLGKDLDSRFNEKSEIESLFDTHSFGLNNLKPNEDTEQSTDKVE